MAPTEIEVKIRFESAHEAKAAILAAGAVEKRSRHFEQNRIFDTEGGDLASREALLRLRSTSDGHQVVTFKEKVETEIRAKVRKEWEVAVGDAEILATILSRAGFAPTYRYEKYRTVFSLGEATIDLDETPIGCFVEIEASPEGIREAAGRLGAGESRFLVEDYRTLNREWRETRGLPPGDMVFEAGAGGESGEG